MTRLALPLLFSTSFLLHAAPAGNPVPLSTLMPRAKDRGSIWWRDGYPGIVDGARWLHCFETGHYRFMLETDKLAVHHMGSSQVPWKDLPGAGLSLGITVDGESYRCQGSHPPSRFEGARLIESGRFLQRADVTQLHFISDEGKELNVDARLETISWPRQMGLMLAARPGIKPLEPGGRSFGRVNGGFGLTGPTRLDLAAEDCHTPEAFTWEFWVYLPLDFQAGRNSPWLMCKNPHEAADGNIGLLVRNGGELDARLNIGGGGANSHQIVGDKRHALKFERWNHVALSYDGQVFRLYANGHFAGEKLIGQKRVPRPGGMAFGGRQDRNGDGYPFRGVVDEIRLYDRALTLGQLRALQREPAKGLPHLKPVRHWPFRNDVAAAATQPRETWKSAALEIRLKHEEKQIQVRRNLPPPSAPDHWEEVSVAFDPVTVTPLPQAPVITVEATEVATGAACPVAFDPVVGCHRVHLDEVAPIPPPNGANPSNDALERVRIRLGNPTGQDQVARLSFDKTRPKQHIGAPITGISAVLRDLQGRPTGIPVQLSKNWHHHPRDSGVHSGQWFHGISLLHLPPKADLELELVIAYGHWGGLPAASHAQLSLIGWGGNQRWDQAAIGSWGESICFDPEQAQARCSITDVRPLMVTSKNEREWNWTRNVGGGDFFRLFDTAGNRLPHTGMQADYHRYGPCLTEVTYRGGIHRAPVRHSETVSLARSNDLVCATYRIRFDVARPVDFSRFAIFQLGADTYHSSREGKIAVGNSGGLLKEWATQWGGDTYRRKPVEGTGDQPWVSLHEAAPDDQPGALANRGLVIREWKAVLGGREAGPWFVERGVGRHERNHSSIVEIAPPPGLKRLEAGDFVEATIQHLVIPRSADDYYGPNEAHRASLAEAGDTWRPVLRQADGDKLGIEVKTGRLERLYPDVRVATVGDTADLTLTSGIGHVAVTFTGLTSNDGYRLLVDGKPLNQAVHGNDFWQADYDPARERWSLTFNIPAAYQQAQRIRLQRAPRP